MTGFDWAVYGLMTALWGAVGTATEPSTGPDPEEVAVIRRAKDGDGRAFEVLVRRYQRGIYGLAMRMMLNHQDADDVVQEAFIKAYTNLQSYSEEFKFYTWLYRITMNTALTMLKQRHRTHSSLDSMIDDEHFQPAVEMDVEQDIEYSDIEAKVRGALDRIHPDLRSVFVLRTWGELSYQEIADTLGIQLGTVMSRLNRARGRLQKMLLEEIPTLRHAGPADGTDENEPENV